MAPFNFWPALFLGLSGFFILLNKTPSNRGALITGWLFGLGYFLFGLFWIGNALLVEGNSYRWAWPLAVLGLPVVFSFYTGAAAYLTKRFLPGSLFGFASIFSLSEWLRGHLFTGFPWNLAGYAWADILPIVQIVSIGSVYTLTLLTYLWAATPGFLFVSNADKKNKTMTGILVLASMALTYGYGAWRLNQNPTAFHEDTAVKIIQPNIAQEDKWDRSKLVENFYNQLDISKSEDQPYETTYILWPETALSRWFLNDTSSLSAIRDTLGTYQGNSYLLAGTLIYDEADKSYANSIVLIDKNGRQLNRYDKSHLVPFGEYIPFQNYIPLAPVSGFKGLKKGDGKQNQSTPEGLSYSPLICYEIIFPGAAVASDQPTPDFIVNVSNDAWYGDSSGPHQHFTKAAFRAVEEGIPVIRSANTGISGIIDPLGRTLHKTDLFQQNATLHPIPKRADIHTAPPIIRTILFLALTALFLVFALKRR